MKRLIIILLIFICGCHCDNRIRVKPHISYEVDEKNRNVIIGYLLKAQNHYTIPLTDIVAELDYQEFINEKKNIDSAYICESCNKKH